MIFSVCQSCIFINVRTARFRSILSLKFPCTQAVAIPGHFFAIPFLLIQGKRACHLPISYSPGANTLLATFV